MPGISTFSEKLIKNFSVTRDLEFPVSDELWFSSYVSVLKYLRSLDPAKSVQDLESLLDDRLYYAKGYLPVTFGTVSGIVLNWRVICGYPSRETTFLETIYKRTHNALFHFYLGLVYPIVAKSDPFLLDSFPRYFESRRQLLLQDPNTDPPELPLLESEKPAFEHYLADLASNPVYWEHLKNRLTAHLNTSLLRSPWDTVVNSLMPKNCSFISSDTLEHLFLNFESLYKLPPLTFPPHYPNRMPGILREALFAKSFAYNRAGISIVHSGALPGIFEPVLLINFREYPAFRPGAKIFYHRLLNQKQHKMGNHTRAQLYKDIFESYFSKYLLMFDPYVFTDYLNRVDKDPTIVLALPFSVIKQALTDYTKTNVSHVDLLPKSVTAHTRKGVKTRFALSPDRIIRETSPVAIEGISSPTFSYTLNHGIFWVNPPWHVSLQELDHMKHDYRILGKHVFVRLMSLRMLSATRDYWNGDLDKWLTKLSNMSPGIFKEEVRQYNRTNPDKYYKRLVKGAEGLRFTAEEDEAIKRYLRPRMSAEDKKELNKICFKRTKQQITNRAKVLREELLAEGVCDFDKLPRAINTDELWRRIKKMKK